MKINRIKSEQVINVTVDYNSKNVRLDIDRKFLDDEPQCQQVSLELTKNEVTKLIAALKSQRDRKGTK